MLKDNYGGESTGKGFYVYNDKGRNQPNPLILKCIKEAVNLSGISILLEVARLFDEEIHEAYEMMYVLLLDICKRGYKFGYRHQLCYAQKLSILYICIFGYVNIYRLCVCECVFFVSFTNIA